jgi:hypothetical protein
VSDYVLYRPWFTLPSASLGDPDGGEGQPGAPPAVPTVTELMPPMPNPFNPMTTLRYRLSLASEVELTISGVDGRRVRTLVNGLKDAGEYVVVWNGMNDRGVVASGLYDARFKTPDVAQTRSLILLK